MNHYLIWTDKGWMKTPIYNQFICRKSVNDVASYDEVNTTYNIRCAYKFDENQIKDALEFLQGFGVASWAVEYKEDLLIEALKNLEKKVVRNS